MYEYSFTANWGVALAAQMTLLVLLLSPGIPFEIWYSLSKKWAAYRSQVLSKRSRRAGERLKRYWEIDMRKYK